LAPTARAHGWARYIKTSTDNQTERLGETNVFKLLDTITQLFICQEQSQELLEGCKNLHWKQRKKLRPANFSKSSLTNNDKAKVNIAFAPLKVLDDSRRATPFLRSKVNSWCRNTSKRCGPIVRHA